MIVVDADILAYLYLPGKNTARAEALLQEDPEWAAPILWRSRFRDILAQYVQRGEVSLEQACRIYEAAVSLMAGREYQVDPAQVLALASGSGCTAGASEYVAVAATLGVELVTCDKQILRAFPEVAVAL